MYYCYNVQKIHAILFIKSIFKSSLLYATFNYALIKYYRHHIRPNANNPICPNFFRRTKLIQYLQAIANLKIQFLVGNACACNNLNTFIVRRISGNSSMFIAKYTFSNNINIFLIRSYRNFIRFLQFITLFKICQP